MSRPGGAPIPPVDPFHSLSDFQRAPVSDALLRFVADAGRDLSALDSRQAITAVSGLALPMLADVAVVVVTRDGEAPRLAVAHIDPGSEDRLHVAVLRRLPALLALAARVRRPFRLRWLRTLTPSSLRGLGSGADIVLVLAQQIGAHSLLVLPLRVRGRDLGVLALARLRGSPRYSAAEFAGGSVLATRASLILENARLQDALDKWAHVFEQAQWGAAILDGDDRTIEAANGAFARMHGFPDPTELIGRPFASLEAPDTRLSPGIGPVLDDAERPIEKRHRRPDGSTFPVLVNVTAMRVPDGTTLYHAANIHDLSDLRRTEERLHRAQRMEAVGRLAGGVAHEVNNMMTIVLGFGDFLLHAPDMPPERLEDVEEMLRAAGRAAGVTRQLLAFSRQQVLQVAPLDLNEVVRDTAELLAPLLPAEVAVSARVAWPHVMALGDRSQLEQVLINLAFNARDAMPRGGTLVFATEVRDVADDSAHPDIGTSMPPGRYATLQVTDSGSGMDAETQSHVFEPFFTTKAVGQGTGLGLSTVYGIVKQSGGYVWVESEPGAGATFTICLPYAGGVEAPVPADAAPGPRTMQHGRVLLVEDEEILRTLAARVLREEGYEVLEASTGAEALALASDPARPLGLVITDLAMPRMGGRELRERLLDVSPDLPVLFISGYNTEDAVLRDLLAGGDAFLQKPFRPSELADRVRELFEKGGPVPDGAR